MTKSIAKIGMQLLLIGVLYLSASYSSIDFSNSGSIALCTNENGLISTPSSIDAGEIIQGEDRDVTFEVANYIGEDINIYADYDRDNISIKMDTAKIDLESNKNITLNIKTTADAAEGSQTVNVTFLANWEGGESEFKLPVDITVIKKPEPTVKPYTGGGGTKTGTQDITIHIPSGSAVETTGDLTPAIPPPASGSTTKSTAGADGGTTKTSEAATGDVSVTTSNKDSSHADAGTTPDNGSSAISAPSSNTSGAPANSGEQADSKASTAHSRPKGAHSKSAN